ncbi:hypothetical protein BS47DRAFT_1368154 [Hydnum rufescens UP504]|uniref:Uncharacterized protein n=1 Tax=Hydnum rufescens UP504 TaxID=1448309 RepID=A0A9P6AGJ0_9AGAM|nr:hypothetical protein BS47DRAFT_1368154 [Hydnum rufescens UP504]
MTTHPPLSWPGGSKEKPANNKGPNGQGPNNNVPTEYATNKKTPNNATTTGVWFYVRGALVFKTKPGNKDAQRKMPETLDGTTHPLQRVSSLHKDPPNEDMDKLPVRTATQALSACWPPKMMIDEIVYHTPTKVPSLCENPPDEDTDKPAPPKPQCPPPEMMINEITYHTPAEVDQAWGKTWDHAATHTPILNFLQHIQGQNKYSTTHLLQWVYDNAKRAAPTVEEKMFEPQKPLGLSSSRKSASYQHRTLEEKYNHLY